MSETVEVFEKEEAERFLEYFLAYKKICAKADNLKRMIASNSQSAKADHFEPARECQSTIGLEPAHIEVEAFLTKL